MTPEFEIKLEARAVSKFSPKGDVKVLVDFLRAQKWKGRLSLDFPGNGGIQTVMFEETRKMVEDNSPNPQIKLPSGEV